MSTMRISELAKATTTSATTIRYYEQIRLLPFARRAFGGHRQYGRADVDRLALIRRCRALGFTLSEIRTFVAIATGTKPSGDCRNIVIKRLDAVRTQREKLEAIESRLESMLLQSSPKSSCDMLGALA